MRMCKNHAFLENQKKGKDRAWIWSVESLWTVSCEIKLNNPKEKKQVSNDLVLSI